MLNTFPTPEGFKGSIVSLKVGDLFYIKPILQTWIRDRNTGEELPNEVTADLIDMRNSILGLNEYKYIVALNETWEAIGIMGLRPPAEKMSPYITTSNPCELINAYVHIDYVNGKGVGRALVNGLIELATFLGYTEIILNSGPRYEKSAWPFYDKVFGERVALAIGMYPDKKGQGGDAPIWRKIL